MRINEFLQKNKTYVFILIDLQEGLLNQNNSALA